MGDNLSQDELDKLLSGVDDAAEGGSAASVGDALTNDEYAKLEPVFTAGWAQLAGNMSQSLGHDVTIDFGVAASATSGSLTSDVEGLGVLVHFDVTAAGGAHHGMVMQKEEVAKLGALLAGGDPTDETLSAESLQAVADMLDMSLPIVAGHIQTALGEPFEFGPVATVNAEDPTAEFDADAIGLGGALARLEYAMVVGDVMACPLLYTMPVEHARQLAALLPDPAPAAASAPAGKPFAEFESARAADTTPSIENMDLILDIELEVVARLGTIQMPIREILKLGPGAIIDIDRPADAPVELVVNDKLVARGDVVVVQENFGLKISEVQSPQERIASLRQ